MIIRRVALEAKNNLLTEGHTDRWTYGHTIYKVTVPLKGKITSIVSEASSQILSS